MSSFPDDPGPRQGVRETPDGVHGGLDFAELQKLGLRAGDVLDFSANVNPFGPSERVRAALAGVPLDRYPDRDCLELRSALAALLGVPPQQILPGNGACELIWLAALAFVRAGDPVLVLGPTFCEYARAAGIMGARVVTCRALEERAFVPDLGAVNLFLKRLEPGVVFLCNPNNPTGRLLPPEVIAGWAREYPRTLFVVDEAYRPIAAGLASPLSQARDNVLVLRSMTKDFGLAGLRLGYAIADERLLAPLRRVQPPWSVNALAQEAGVAALHNLDHHRRTLEQLDRARQDLTAGLIRLGLSPLPSAAPFFLLRVGDGAAFRQALLRRGVLVRDCASFGLPAHVRIAARRPEENERLLCALSECEAAQS